MRAPTRTSQAFIERPIVERPRLIRLLDRATTRIILLCAPAGYGKTTLARQWLTRRKHVWYSCTAASSDVAGLAADLFKALVEVHPHLEREMRLHLRVAAEAPDQLEHLTEVMVDHFAAWPADTLLAIDDYQLIAESAASEALFTALVQRTSVPLLITARQRPGWATARSRLYGDTYELDQFSLAITRAESGSFIGDTAPLVTRELASICRGWPALVALARTADTRSLPRRSDPLPGWIEDFIVHEVIPATPAHLLQLATAFSPIGSVDSHVYRHIVGASAERLHLTGLRDYGFLAIPHSSSREPAPPLHPAIRSTLLLLAQDTPTRQLARRIGEELLRAERWDDAFATAAHFHDDELREATIRKSLYPLLSTGRLRTLRTWLSSQGNTTIGDLAFAEIASRDGDFLRAESLATNAASIASDDPWLQTQALIAAGRSAHLSHNDSRAAAHFASASESATTPEQRQEACWGSFVSAAALDELPTSELRTLIQNATGSGPLGQIRRATGLYAIGRSLASMAEAYDSLELASPLLERVSDPLAASSFMHAYSNTLAIGANYESSLEVLGSAIPHALRYKIRFALAHHFITQAVAQTGLLLIDAARQSIGEARSSPTNENARRFVEMNAAAAESRLELLSGNYDRAITLSVDKWHGVSDKGMRAELMATHAIALYVAGDLHASAEATTEAWSLARSVESYSLHVALQIMKHCNAEEPDNAVRLVRDLVERKGLDALILVCRLSDLTASMLSATDVVGALIRHYIPRDNTIRLGAANKTQRRGRSARNPFGLTPKELEIAQLLTQGLSNRELASQLFVTEATAKLHLRHIYAKLGTRSRTEAVVKLLRFQSNSSDRT